MAQNNESDHQESIRRLERKVFDFFTLSQLGKSLISIQDMDNLARVFASSVHEVSQAENACLLIYDLDQSAYTYHYSIGLDENSVKNISFKEQEGLFWQVLSGGEPFAIRDSSGKYRFESIVEKFQFDQLNSQIWVPLMVKNMVRGVLTLGAKKDGSAYDDEQLNFIAQLASQAAIAIDSALLDQQKARATVALGKKMENLSVLYDVSKALNFTNDLKQTLLMILDKARSAVSAQKASMMLLNDETRELEVRVVRGIDPLVERKINMGEIECTKIKIGEGIAGRVVETKEAICVDNVHESKDFKKSDKSNVESILCVPMINQDECIGVLNITNKTSGEKFTKEDTELLTTLAGQAAVTISNANLYHLAITDGLTQLYIHRYFRQKLVEEIRRSLRYKRSFSLILSDIDHFKRFNDTYGHQQGDAVLATTAKIFKSKIRDLDIACRYGGEEFAILLPETDLQGAIKAAERIREAVESYEYPALEGDEPLKVTLSLGVATCPAHSIEADGLIKKADVALYACKEAGRNCVKSFESDMLPEEQESKS